jgi:hypothetical protein
MFLFPVAACVWYNRSRLPAATAESVQLLVTELCDFTQTALLRNRVQQPKSASDRARVLRRQ